MHVAVHDAASAMPEAFGVADPPSASFAAEELSGQIFELLLNNTEGQFAVIHSLFFPPLLKRFSYIC